MKKQPLVSVIIPTYNRKKLLSKTINSVINQTYKNWELIIVDDGSTDNTKESVQKYMKKDKRIKYVRNTHKKGAGGARNQGIEVAKGDYIAFLDSDDIWLPKKLEIIKRSNVDFILSESFINCDFLEKVYYEDFRYVYKVV